MEGGHNDRFFLHEAHVRVIRLEQFLAARFDQLYERGGRTDKRPDLRHPASIMQERYDDQIVQVKKLAKFDIAKQEELMKLSAYEFLFHLSVIKEED